MSPIFVNLLMSLLMSLFLLYPLWIICRRAGLNPYWALLVFIPYIGVMAVAVALGSMRWKRFGGGDWL